MVQGSGFRVSGSGFRVQGVCGTCVELRPAVGDLQVLVFGVDGADGEGEPEDTQRDQVPGVRMLG